MKKLSILLFVSLSLLSFSQSWESNYPDSNFKDIYKSPYENAFDLRDNEQQLYKKKQKEIAQEATYIKTICNDIKNIFENAEHDQSAKTQIDDSSIAGPGAPGEPVTINNKMYILSLAALMLMFYYHYNRKNFGGI